MSITFNKVHALKYLYRLQHLLKDKQLTHYHTLIQNRSAIILHKNIVLHKCDASFRFMGHENKDTFFKPTQRHQIVSLKSLFLNFNICSVDFVSYNLRNALDTLTKESYIDFSCLLLF